MEMVELLVTDQWQSMKEIAMKQAEYGIRDSKDIRQFRREVERFNSLYDGHKHKKYVVHQNGKGYKFATNGDEIRASVADLSKRAVTMFRHANEARKALGLAQLQILEIEEQNE